MPPTNLPAGTPSNSNDPSGEVTVRKGNRNRVGAWVNKSSVTPGRPRPDASTSRPAIRASYEIDALASAHARASNRAFHTMRASS
jgi:hypothetical protein